MSESIEELLEAILAELKTIGDDVAYIKMNSDSKSDTSGIVEALDALGDKIIGSIGDSLLRFR